MQTNSRVPARIAAVLALAAAVVIVLVIVSSNQNSDPVKQNAAAAAGKKTERKARPRRAAYVVKEGDTLLGIASKTGVEINRLEQLNPEIDPQRLIAGQRIKLR